MLRGVGPEGDGHVAGKHVDADELQHRVDGALRDAVQLVHVRGAGGLVGLADALGGEEVLELSCERNSAALLQCTAPRTMEVLLARELTTDLRVAMYSFWLPFGSLESVRLFIEAVDGLEPRVVVDEHEQVLRSRGRATPCMGRSEMSMCTSHPG